MTCPMTCILKKILQSREGFNFFKNEILTLLSDPGYGTREQFVETFIKTIYQFPLSLDVRYKLKELAASPGESTDSLGQNDFVIFEEAGFVSINIKTVNMKLKRN